MNETNIFERIFYIFSKYRNCIGGNFSLTLSIYTISAYDIVVDSFEKVWQSVDLNNVYQCFSGVRR